MDAINMTLEKSALVVVVIYLSCVIHLAVKSDDADDAVHGNSLAAETAEELFPEEPGDKVMEKAIQKYEKYSAQAKNVAADRVTDFYEDSVVSYHRNMLSCVKEIIELMNNPSNAYRFLRQKGIDRVIIRDLSTSDRQLQTQLLMLTKIIFDIAPTATSLTIPIIAIDKLLDVFEDGNPATKAHVLDILYLWLPGNPRVQARVMKLKGLDPFYKLISQLDTVTVVQVLLDLFNKILIEHIDARNESKLKTTKDILNLEIYKRIGLIERMSTPTVCSGMLTIFQTVWEQTSGEKEVLTPVLELIMNVKPFCLEYYKGKLRALNTFKDYLKYVQKLSSFNVSLNKNEMLSVLEEYIDVIEPTVKVEL